MPTTMNWNSRCGRSLAWARRRPQRRIAARAPSSDNGPLSLPGHSFRAACATCSTSPHTAAGSAPPAAPPVRGADRPGAQHLQSRAGSRPGKQYREPLRDPAGGGLHDPVAASVGHDPWQADRRVPKVHVIDSGLACWLLGLSAAKISSRDPAVLTAPPAFFGGIVFGVPSSGISSRPSPPGRSSSR